MLDGTAEYNHVLRNHKARHFSSLKLTLKEMEHILSVYHVPGICRYIDFHNNMWNKLYSITLLIRELKFREAV